MKTLKVTALMIIGAVLIQSAYSQKLVSKDTHISFIASTPLEDIVAHNRQAVSILDPATGDIAFNVLIKSFEFKVKLMQEHFNENYLESDKYPKSTFKGRVINNNNINYRKDGIYDAEVEGDLTIHNVTHKIRTKGSIEVKGNVVNAKAGFIVKPADYNISIPSVVENKIAKEVQVSVDATYSSIAGS